MSETLKPCPFCGGYNRRICQVPTYYTLNPHIWYVKCWDCEAQGSRHFTEDEAFNAWNTRAERTCRNEHGHCSECAAVMYDAPSYCPNCGARVVK